MPSAAEHSSVDPGVSGHDCLVPLDINIDVVGLLRIVVEGAIHKLPEYILQQCV